MKRFIQKHNRTIVKVMAVVLVIGLIIGGTYAFIDYNQHATNIAEGKSVKYDVTLNDDFKSFVDDWKIGADHKIDKNVSVSYPVPEEEWPDYGDVYVRLKFYELLAYTPVAYMYSEYRYMTYSTGTDKGYFICEPIGLTDPEYVTLFDTNDLPIPPGTSDYSLDDAGDALTALKAKLTDYDPAWVASLTIGDVEVAYDYLTDTWNWYIITDFDYPDGEYGKHLVINAVPSEGEDPWTYIAGTTPALPYCCEPRWLAANRSRWLAG